MQSLIRRYFSFRYTISGARDCNPIERQTKNLGVGNSNLPERAIAKHI